jgi:hypothetical protein
MSSLRIREGVADKPLVESVGERCARLGVRVECAGGDVLLHSGASSMRMRARAGLRDMCAAHSWRSRRAEYGSDGQRGCATKAGWAIVNGCRREQESKR